MAGEQGTQAPPVHAPAPPVPAPAPTAAPAPAAPTADTGISASAYGRLADGGFLARLGTGLRLSAEQLAAGELDMSALPQPLPGVRLDKLKKRGNNLDVHGTLAIPHVEGSELNLRLGPEGSATLRGRLRTRLQVPALGSPRLEVALGETGQLDASVEFTQLDLLPRGLRAEVTGAGQLVLQAGRLGGAIQVAVTYPQVGSASANLGFSPEGAFTGSGTVQLTPPFLTPLDAALSTDAEGNLNGQLQLEVGGTTSPLPGLELQAGTITLGYLNQQPSLAITGFSAAYAGVGQVQVEALELSGRRPSFAGAGTVVARIPGMDEVTGRVRINDSKVSGRLQLGVRDFPEGLPLRNGQLTLTLAEDGNLGFSGQVGLTLGPAGEGQLQASYDQGHLNMGAQVQLTVPGMQPVSVTVNYADGALSGSVEAPINPELIPGLSGTVHIEYAQDRWSGSTTLNYSADDGKLSGTITVTVAQTEQGTLELGGSGQVTAQLMPSLAGTLTATILPEGGVDVSGTIQVTEPVRLFDEKRVEKELFSHSQNIPLWAILVAVIRIRAGVRAGIGPGVFRNITVTGSYTLGAQEADPSFSVTGELFIPAFVEGYVAFGAGLGLDVVLGSLTGGIEAMGTAGLYGAISVIPELTYQDGQWSIAGVATLAAGARLKLSLNAWAEIEALWVTVWDNTWELASVTMPIGPDLALQARMNYIFGRPEPPELEFSSSDIDSESLIQSAMPEDGPPPSGAREALQNKAEWQGALREQRTAAVPPELAAQAQQGQPAPAAPARPPERTSPPAGTGEQATDGAATAAAPASQGAVGAPGTPPDTPDQNNPVVLAGKPDDTLPAAVPEAQLPNTDQPRFPGPITLATLDEPPVPAQRSQQQMHEDLEAAGKALDLAMGATSASDELAAYFPRIKNRFRLASLGYEGDFESGFDIVAKINPELRRTRLNEPLRGTGMLDAGAGKHVTNVDFSTSNVGGGVVGSRMIANPLGPDHPLGSPPRGVQAVMSHLGDQYIRGHLLNENLGGPGENFNLFPITRSANAMHHTGIEDTVKQWVNSQRYWVRYEVLITNFSGLKTTTDGLRKYLDADIKAEAHILDLDMNPWRTVKATIPSVFDVRSVVSNASDTTRPARDPADEALREVRDVDRNATVLVKTGEATAFPAAMRQDLAELLAAHGGWGRTREFLETATGVGPATALALQHAFELTASNYNGTTVPLSDPLEKRLVTLAEGNWSHIMAELAEKAKPIT